MEMEYIISHYIWTKALLGEEKKKKKEIRERGNIYNVYRNVERVFKENVRKKKSIMLPVSTFAFQSATLLPSQQVDAGSLLISLSTDGIANTRHGDLDRKKKKGGKEKVIIIIVTIKGKNRKSSESRPRSPPPDCSNRVVCAWPISLWSGATCSQS